MSSNNLLKRIFLGDMIVNEHDLVNYNVQVSRTPGQYSFCYAGSDSLTLPSLAAPTLVGVIKDTFNITNPGLEVKALDLEIPIQGDLRFDPSEPWIIVIIKSGMFWSSKGDHCFGEFDSKLAFCHRVSYLMADFVEDHDDDIEFVVIQNNLVQTRIFMDSENLELLQLRTYFALLRSIQFCNS